MMLACRGHDPVNFRNFQRISTWLAGSAVLWIAGGILSGYERVALWIVALALENRAVRAAVHTPGAGHRNHGGTHHGRGLGDAFVRTRRGAGENCRGRTFDVKRWLFTRLDYPN